MASAPPADIELNPIGGDSRPLAEWLTTFHLVTVVLDPFTWESAWILETAGRLLRTYSESDCRVAWMVTATPAEAQQFLGPWADEILTFVDPDRAFVKAVGLEHLPAFLHITQDGALAGAAEGWDAAEWRPIAHELSRVLSWSTPVLPAHGDPGAFPGTPALGAPAEA